MRLWGERWVDCGGFKGIIVAKEEAELIELDQKLPKVEVGRELRREDWMVPVLEIDKDLLGFLDISEKATESFESLEDICVPLCEL